VFKKSANYSGTETRKNFLPSELKERIGDDTVNFSLKGWVVNISVFLDYTLSIARTKPCHCNEEAATRAVCKRMSLTVSIKLYLQKTGSWPRGCS